MYALIDCNNFYASCEKVFDLKLTGKALVILSNNDGCVIARSDEAKKLGIKMGQPAFEIKDLVNSGVLHVRSSNFALYADMSFRVVQTLAQFDFDTEIYSIDEVFMSLSHINKLDLENIGNQIRKKVKMWTGIPVSVGIAPTKTLAKLAVKIAKRGSYVKVLTDKQEMNSVLAKTDLKDIWGIGMGFCRRLQKALINNALTFKETDEIRIRKILGVTGLRINLELNGICALPLEVASNNKKSILSSRSFKNSLSDLSDLEENISVFTARVAEKLRKEKKCTSYISVFVATSPFDKNYYFNSSGMTITIATSCTTDLISYAKKCLKKVYRSKILYKKAGVMICNFSDQSTNQKDLFCKSEDIIKKERVMSVIDKINNYYDKKALFFMAEGVQKKQKITQANLSPKYTTCWEDILKVK